jgi:hypothetical protein
MPVDIRSPANEVEQSSVELGATPMLMIAVSVPTVGADALLINLKYAHVAAVLVRISVPIVPIVALTLVAFVDAAEINE